MDIIKTVFLLSPGIGKKKKKKSLFAPIMSFSVVGVLRAKVFVRLRTVSASQEFAGLPGLICQSGLAPPLLSSH